MQMMTLNRYTWCRITRYSQSDCQESKSVMHEWEVWVFLDHVSLAMAEKINQASHLSKTQSHSSTHTSHSLSSWDCSGKHAASMKTHTHLCNMHTNKILIFMISETLWESMVECWLDLHVDKMPTVKWAYYHADYCDNFNCTNCSCENRELLALFTKHLPYFPPPVLLQK